MKNTLHYKSNNSGGSWWLGDEDWANLEKAGWTVQWVRDDPDRLFVSSDGRFLGALATSAYKEGTDPDTLIEEWEDITGQVSTDEGCPCCGEPHGFTWYDADGNSKYSEVRVTATERGWWG